MSSQKKRETRSIDSPVSSDISRGQEIVFLAESKSKESFKEDINQKFKIIKTHLKKEKILRLPKSPDTELRPIEFKRPRQAQAYTHQ